MHTKPTATGFNLKQRIEQARERLQHIVKPPSPQPQPGVLLLPAPAPKQQESIVDAYQRREAEFWERNPPKCPDCGSPMTKLIVDTDHHKAGERYCGPCYRLGLHARLMHDKSATMSNLFRPGELALLRRAGMRDTALKDVCASYDTRPDLSKDVPPIIAELKARQQHQTGELPARDIERANSAKIPATNAPATPIPRARESLFADVPETVMAMAEEDDITEKRIAVKLPATTQEMRTEVLLYDLMNGKTHERDTGANEAIATPERNWML